VLAGLQAAGSDLSKPHPIEFFLYFPTREAADRALPKVLENELTAEVKKAETDEEWLILATKNMIPKEVDLANLGSRLTAIASAEGGKYDGWGSPVVP
jgi:hypothetical protein